MTTFGLPRNIDPHDALREEIARTAGHVDWLAQIIAGLERDEIISGIEETRTGTNQGGLRGDVRVASITRKAAPNVWVQLYQKERAHLVKVSATAIACGLAEREVRLAEEEGKIIAAIFRAVEADPRLAFSPDVRKVFRGVVADHLRVVPSLNE